MIKYSCILWLGIALFFSLIAINSFLALRSIEKVEKSLSTEGGLMYARRRELELEGATPLNFGKLIMAQLKKLQCSSLIGAIGAVLAALLSAWLSGP